MVTKTTAPGQIPDWNPCPHLLSSFLLLPLYVWAAVYQIRNKGNKTFGIVPFDFIFVWIFRTFFSFNFFSLHTSTFLFFFQRGITCEKGSDCHISLRVEMTLSCRSGMVVAEAGFLSWKEDVQKATKAVDKCSPAAHSIIESILKAEIWSACSRDS